MQSLAGVAITGLLALATLTAAPLPVESFEETTVSSDSLDKFPTGYGVDLGLGEGTDLQYAQPLSIEQRIEQLYAEGNGAFETCVAINLGSLGNFAEVMCAMDPGTTPGAAWNIINGGRYSGAFPHCDLNTISCVLDGRGNRLENTFLTFVNGNDNTVTDSFLVFVDGDRNVVDSSVFFFLHGDDNVVTGCIFSGHSGDGATINCP